MTSPASPGGPSPLRLGGFALVGLAVVAALVGLFTLATGGASTTDQALAPASSTAGEPAAPPAPPAADPVPAPAPTPAAPPAPTAAPPTPAPPTTPPPSDEPIPPFDPEADSGDDDPVSSARAPLRVYNNSTVKGLAERAADDFRASGWDVDFVGNYASGVIPTSTVYYAPGNADAAEALAAEFNMRARPGFDGLQFGGDNLVVIITREYQSS